MSKFGPQNPAYKHGMRHTRLHRVWAAMISRCIYPSQYSYPWYGGKGIQVCEKWKEFKIFAKWALSHGYADNLTIDRIDPDGNYEPANCRFIPKSKNRGRTGGLKKPVINEKGEWFKSASAAARFYHRHSSAISAVARGRQKTAAGLKWRYA